MMRMCTPDLDKVPTTIKENWKRVFDYIIDNAPGGQTMKDLYNSSTAIFLSMGLAFFWGILYIFLMSIFAEYIAWGIIAITQLGFIGLTIGAFAYYTQAGKEMKTVALLIGIAGAIMSLIVCVCIYCGWSSLKKAIDVVDASADFLASTKRVIAPPLLYFIVMTMFFFFWLGCVVCVYSMGKIVPKPDYTAAGVYIPQMKDVEFQGKA
jgi:hypothetical protein